MEKVKIINEKELEILGNKREYKETILSGGIKILNIREKIYGKELEYFELDREKIRVKDEEGKTKKYVPMVVLDNDKNGEVYGVVQLIQMK